MAAVAVTAGTITVENLGSIQAQTQSITSVDDGDTFAAGSICGFSKITNVIFTPTTAVVAVPTFSGSTVTFKVAAGSVAGVLTVFGK